MVDSGRSRLDQLKAALQGLETENAEDWNEQNKVEIEKLKATIAGLDQLENGDWNKGHEDQLEEIQTRLDKLKSSQSGIDNLNENDYNEKPIASYQEFFSYNNKELKTKNSAYIEMIDKAIALSKTTGKVKISIESSASRVPTRTHKTNDKLALKRANTAKAKVIESLVAKGINKSKIVVLNINSKVRGPKYNGDYTNESVYEKFQYVTIRIH